MTRGTALALLPALGVLAAAGCYRERDRLDIPELSLELADTTVSPSDSIRGVVRASDGSGLSLLRILRISALDVSRQRLDTARFRIDLDGRHRYERSFAFGVGSVVPVGSFIELQAFVVDNQDFSVELRDTVRVKDSR